jgi:paraquat-inducible protein B
VDVSLGASGLKVNTESLATVISGGIAFRAPAGSGKHSPAHEDARFTLFSDEQDAMKPPDGPPVRLTMRFHQSVRGLAVGAPIDFLGIDMGKVTDVSLDFDPKTKRFPADVTAIIYPQRIGKAQKRFVERTGNDDPGALLGVLVKHGLRAQLRSANLLTGQLYVAMDFFPKAPKVKFNGETHPLVVPTVPGSFDKLQQQLGDIVDKVHKIPFDDIGLQLDASLKHLNGLLGTFNNELAPEAKSTLEQARKTLGTAGQALSGNSPLRQSLGQTLMQLQRAARSMRVLANYLSRHPESLLRGRRNNDPAPAAPPRQRQQPRNRP